MLSLILASAHGTMATMTRDQSVDDPSRGLGRTRSRVLALMQDVSEPLTVDAVARRMSLHPNTARFHLEALETAALVVRTPEPRDQRRPGRPRTLFGAAPGVPGVGRRSYRFLAEVLTSYLANRLPEPSQSAEEAGIAWGRYLAEPSPPFHEMEVDAALEALVSELEKVGFESHPAGDGDQLRVEVSHCPFLEVAEDHREVVCSVHLGLMKGLLERMNAPLTAADLEPLVEPSRCIAHLRPVARG